MNKRKVPTSQKTHQITNRPTNQGRPKAKHCLCRGCRDSLSASALAGVEGYTKSTDPKGRAVDSSICPPKARLLRNYQPKHKGLNIRRVNLSQIESITSKGV
jgi:hypothetical protein